MAGTWCESIEDRQGFVIGRERAGYRGGTDAIVGRARSAVPRALHSEGYVMAPLPPPFACGLSERIVSLCTDEVQPQGIDLDFIAIDPPCESFEAGRRKTLSRSLDSRWRGEEIRSRRYRGERLARARGGAVGKAKNPTPPKKRLPPATVN
jgi:hypothetical protein